MINTSLCKPDPGFSGFNFISRNFDIFFTSPSLLPGFIDTFVFL